MSLLNLSEVLLSTEFMQPVKIRRKFNGRWEKGVFIEEEKELVLDMLVCAVKDKELLMIPEADRTEETKSFHCLEKLYLTEDEGGKNTHTSDVILHKGKEYKIVSVPDYSDYGYYKAYGVRIRGY